jgi:peroxiredoxin
VTNIQPPASRQILGACLEAQQSEFADAWINAPRRAGLQHGGSNWGVHMSSRFIPAAGALHLALWSAGVSAVGVGEPAPAFQLPSEQRPTSLADFSGKVVLVNFWASWCPPCRVEMPELKKMRAALVDRGFEVVGVNIDKERANALDFMRRNAIDFPVVFDARQEVIARYQAKAMPISYLLDRDGTIRKIFYGYSAEKRAGMESAISELVRSSPIAKAE